MAGWFPLVNSEGVPLEIVLSTFANEGIVPDWIDFIEEAIRNGWNVGALRSRIASSTGDVYGSTHRDRVLDNFDFYINKRK